MSGGGSRGYGSSGGYEPDCSSLQMMTVLNSPQPQVLRQLSKGDRLAIELERTGSARIVVAKFKGFAAGSITGSLLARLIECLEHGEPFSAVVLSVKGGRCEVRVEYGNV